MRRTRLVAALFFLAVACSPTAATPTALVGTDLGLTAAPDFILTDGISGRAIRLADQQGKLVALTFLYTRCPDVCPLTAETIRQAQKQLGAADADQVLFVAVTVDPDHDTPDAVQAFAAAHGLERNFAYLIGPGSSLRAVWSAYGIRVVPNSSTPGHSDAIYLIDRKGRERALVHSDIGAADLLADLRFLLKEK
ncbi:MAG TPA: SCO family protein [Candidatus Saccharimonadales bacterium]|nr:SCO family protein [Candidatus Saccharimonadales bacterium]